MTKTFQISHLRKQLKAIMDQKNVKATTLSLKVGKNPSLVKDLLEKTKDAKLSTLSKLADELGVPVTDLLLDEITHAPIGPNLFVKGRVAAGQWVEAVELPEDEWQSIMGRPDVRAPEESRYFLEVVGDSMDLIYPPGTYVECISSFAAAKPAPGKRVIATRRRRDNLVEATVKELVEIDDELWLVPRSSNPSHQAFKVSDIGGDIEEVAIIATVISSVRPE